MALDIELYRRTVYVPARRGTQSLRRISVIDIHPEGATQTLLFVHGFGVFTRNSICGQLARKTKKEARDTLALQARDTRPLHP